MRDGQVYAVRAASVSYMNETAAGFAFGWAAGVLFTCFVLFFALAVTTRPESRFALTRILGFALGAGASLAALVWMIR